MKVKLPKTIKKVIIDEPRKTVTTLLLGVDNKTLKFVGVAKCSPEDIFDADIGAKISYKRARKAMLSQIRSELRMEVKRGQEYAKVHQGLCDEVTEAIDDLKQGINDILDGYEDKEKVPKPKEMQKKEIEVDGVSIQDGHIKCLWHGKYGFGELDIYSNKDDPYEGGCEGETKSFLVATECMGEDFYQEVLKSMIKYLKDKSTIIE